MVHMHSPDARARRLKRAIERGFFIAKTVQKSYEEPSHPDESDAARRDGCCSDPLFDQDPWARAIPTACSCARVVGWTSIDSSEECWSKYLPRVRPPFSVMCAGAQAFEMTDDASNHACKIELNNALLLIQRQNDTIAQLSSQIDHLHEMAPRNAASSDVSSDNLVSLELEKAIHTQVMSAMSGPMSKIITDCAERVVEETHVVMRQYDKSIQKRLDEIRQEMKSHSASPPSVEVLPDRSEAEQDFLECSSWAHNCATPSKAEDNDPLCTSLESDSLGLQNICVPSSSQGAFTDEAILAKLSSIGFTPLNEEGRNTYVEQIRWLNVQEKLEEGEYLRLAKEFVEYDLLQPSQSSGDACAVQLAFEPDTFHNDVSSFLCGSDLDVQTDISTGMTVNLVDLCKSVDLNGTIGVVLGFDVATQRYKVAAVARKEPIKVRRLNLRYPARCPTCVSEVTSSRCFACSGSHAYDDVSQSALSSASIDNAAKCSSS